MAQADPSASGTAIRRWFRSDESPALAQSHADSPAVARLRRLTSMTGKRTCGISSRRPEVAGVAGVTRPLASPPGECRRHSLSGQCQTVLITRHCWRKKKPVWCHGRPRMLLQPWAAVLIIAHMCPAGLLVEGNGRWRHRAPSATGSGNSGRATRSPPSTSGKATSGGWWAWRRASCRTYRADEVADECERQLESLGYADLRTSAV